MKNKKLILTLMLACSVAMLATGCDSLKKQPETEIVIETEMPTEAETETETETEAETETVAQTETETEPETVAQTETEPRRDLTIDEELAEEKEFDTLRTVYASDDINVRELPGTDGDVFNSFAQGDSIIVTGETPNWYVVELEDYETKGYVSKDFVSDGEVEPKSDEERAALEESYDESAESSENAVNSSVDAEYGVGAYAEPFEIEATAGANVRQTPAADGEIINTISTGTIVKVIGYTDRWYKIEHDGMTGYVNQNLFAVE